MTMQIQSHHVDGVLVVNVAGRVDGSNAVQIETGILDPVTDEAVGLVLDLSELEFISSAGLRAILLAAKELENRNMRFALCDVPESIRNVLRIAGFLRLMDVVDSRKRAIAKFTAG